MFKNNIAGYPKVKDDVKDYYWEVVSVVTAAKITYFLEGMSFPANRQQIMDYARDNNAPQDVLDMLQRMPEGIYYSMAGIWEAIGKAA